ncbi:MAG: HAD family phosphatase [Spirochaetales bacterium]|nr:HAD family phosphatase [Spirochaetales bacterium]
MLIETVIFDMDGVLLDSEHIHKSINQKFFSEIGTPVTDSEYEDNFVGLPLRDMFVFLGRENKLPDTVDGLTKKCGNRILKGFEEAELTAAAGVEELLKELKGRGMNLAVGSSSSPALIALIIEKIGLSRYFDYLVSGYDVERGKPHPDLFLHIAELFGTDPKSCLVIEDSTQGVEASSRAGMNTVGVRNISSGDQNLDKADRIIDDFSNKGRESVLQFLTLEKVGL